MIFFVNFKLSYKREIDKVGKVRTTHRTASNLHFAWGDRERRERPILTNLVFIVIHL